MTENQKSKAYADGILEAYHAHGYGMYGSVMRFISRDLANWWLQGYHSASKGDEALLRDCNDMEIEITKLPDAERKLARNAFLTGAAGYKDTQL